MWCVNLAGPRADLDSVSGRPSVPSRAVAATEACSRLWLFRDKAGWVIGHRVLSYTPGIGPDYTPISPFGFLRLCLEFKIPLCSF